MKAYIGKTGHLNNLLINNENFSFDHVFSARHFHSKIIIDKSYTEVCWGGRVAPSLNVIEKLKKSQCTYISTYMYNDFYDFYQFNKLNDEYLLEKNGWRVIRVPFIENLLPNNVSRLINREMDTKSKYFICLTGSNDILTAIQNTTPLKYAKKNISLTLREKIIWHVFSKIYTIPKKQKIISLKYQYLIVKSLEKFILLLFKTHRLSSVYIGKN